MLRLAFVFVLSIVQLLAAWAQSSPGDSGTVPLSSAEISELTTRATQGDIRAQMDLAEAYEQGNGVSKDVALAAQWCKRAADQGNASAQNHLGTMYRLGIGLEKNQEESIVWYRKAALQKYPNAMFNLGTVYYNGDGVLIDDVAAGAWFLLAQLNGSDPANDAVDRMMRELSPFQIDEAYMRAAEMLRGGKEVPQDGAAAAECYRKAAGRGDVSADIELAQMLVAGLGVHQDYSEARRRCSDAAKAHFGPGAYCMGLMEKNGIGGPQNLESAASYFTQAAELRDDRAMLYLGEMYRNGEGVKQNKETAYMWLWIASNSNVPNASNEEMQLRQQLNDSSISKARKKAFEWASKHTTVSLSRRPNGGR